jgi:hypothetical protein
MILALSAPDADKEAFQRLAEHSKNGCVVAFSCWLANYDLSRGRAASDYCAWTN